jgi:hypothetical protein
MFNTIKAGTRVTIKTPQGNEITGKAVMYNSDYDSWVLNVGGRYGTPKIASRKNVVKINGKLVLDK